MDRDRPFPWSTPAFATCDRANIGSTKAFDTFDNRSFDRLFIVHIPIPQAQSMVGRRRSAGTLTLHLFLGSQRLWIKLHLALVFRLEVTDLEFDRDEALQPPIKQWLTNKIRLSTYF
jgi:hypothetical protein